MRLHYSPSVTIHYAQQFGIFNSTKIHLHGFVLVG